MPINFKFVTSQISTNAGNRGPLKRMNTTPYVWHITAGANSGPELELLANSNSGIGIGIELAFPSLTGIGIELKLPVFELELNWNFHNLNWNWSRNCVLRNRISMELKSDTKSLISLSTVGLQFGYYL